MIKSWFIIILHIPGTMVLWITYMFFIDNYEHLYSTSAHSSHHNLHSGLVRIHRGMEVCSDKDAQGEGSETYQTIRLLTLHDLVGVHHICSLHRDILPAGLGIHCSPLLPLTSNWTTFYIYQRRDDIPSEQSNDLV